MINRRKLGILVELALLACLNHIVGGRYRFRPSPQVLPSLENARWLFEAVGGDVVEFDFAELRAGQAPKSIAPAQGEIPAFCAPFTRPAEGLQVPPEYAADMRSPRLVDPADRARVAVEVEQQFAASDNVDPSERADWDALRCAAAEHILANPHTAPALERLSDA